MYSLSDFEEHYDDLYAKQYGKYRIIRIKEAVENFLECGDYSKGIARIKCTNHNCDHEYFRPFVASLKEACKTWYLCPSCHQKRILLFSEHMANDVLLRLPLRQYVWCIPKAIRIYFRNDKSLFADISKIIFSIINEYYNEASETPLKTGAIISYQSFGDMMRPNSHFHTIILEGGIDNDGSFHSIPIKNTSNLTELFRRRVISYFVKKKLLNEKFARNLLSWKHSGFSVDNSILITAQDQKARTGLSQYIARHPVSLNKIIYIPEKAQVLYKTKYNDYFGENIQLFTATDFIAELTMHIPRKHKHLIRYYGIYSSRSRGKARKDGSLDKFGWGARSEEEPKKEPEENPVETLSEKKSKQTWARLIKKVFEVDPLICPKCGSEMAVLAIITNPEEIQKILTHLRNNKSPPFDNKTQPEAS